MTRDVVVVHTTTPVLDAARRMIGNRVSSTPVIEAEPRHNVLAGFVSEKDILEAFVSGRLHAAPELKVGDLMKVYPATAGPETDLFTLAAIFLQHDYRHVPVTDGQVLQGIVSRRDVLDGLVAQFAEWQRQDPATRKVPDLAQITPPLRIG